jgi:chemotaxis protein MotA
MSGLTQLIDPQAAAIVLGGSIIATSARCGLGSARDAASQIVRLPTRRFQFARVKAALAPMVNDIAKSGLIRASLVKCPDRAVNEGLEAMLRRRSFTAFLAHQQSHRELRLARRFRASESLDTAGELAPILGLTGTLVALSQLDPERLSDPSAMVSAISAAILSTLYGLLLAHFICHPLARAIERRGKAEEEARAALTDWLAHHIPADSTPAADDMSLITRDAA